MKKYICVLISIMFVICILSSTSVADGLQDRRKSRSAKNEVLEALNNATDIEFSPSVTVSFDSDWLASSELRATLTYLLAYDLYSAGFPEVCDAVTNYDSYIGQYGEMYIVSGMYKSHAFIIYYFPSEHAAIYRVAPISMSNGEIESSLDGTMLACTDYYLNNKKDINTFADVLASSSK